MDRDFISEPSRLLHYVNSLEHHECPFCRENFESDTKLEVHNHEDNSNCQWCGEWFATERGMNEHARQAHYYCMQHSHFIKKHALDHVCTYFTSSYRLEAQGYKLVARF